MGFINNILLLLLLVTLSTCSEIRKSITVAYYNSPSSVELAKQIRRVYKRDVFVVTLPFDDTEDATDAEKMNKSLSYLKEEITVGVTSRDLYKKIIILDGYLCPIEDSIVVVGFTSQEYKTASISSYRTRDEREDRSHLISTALHEIGHIYGLKHCLEKDCFMLSIEFEEPAYHLCKECTKKLHESVLYKK